MFKVLLLIQNRLKIMFKDKLLWGIFVFVFMFFFVVLNNLIDYMDVGSRMPIAIIDKDQSIVSKTVINNLEEQDALYVRVVSEDHAFSLLKDAKVEAVYELPEGFEKQLLALELEGLIHVYHLEGSSAGRVVSDIFAGEMMYEICVVKTLEVYERSLDRKGILDETLLNDFRNDVERLRNEDVYGPIMKVTMFNVREGEVINVVDNSIIYQQVVIGMLATFLGFFLLFATTSFVKDKELGIDKRLKSIQSNYLITYFAHTISLMVVGGLISCGLSLLIIYRFNMLSLNGFFMVWLLYGFYIFAISSFFVFLSTFIKKVITLQVSGALVLIVFAIFGGSFWNTDFINHPFVFITKAIPNHLFVNGFIQALFNQNMTYTTINYLTPLFSLGILFLLIGFLMKYMIYLTNRE